MRQLCRVLVNTLLTAMLRGIVAAAACVPLPVLAANIDLSSANATLAIRCYGLGLIPLDGAFTRFGGHLRFSPDHHDCEVTLHGEAASLVMGEASAQQEILSETFLDAGHYPALAFSGACAGNALRGVLTLHGETHPFELALDWQPSRVVATGRLRRAEWGMTAKPLLGGTTVRIEVRVTLPPA